jgi:hypothetical protein
VSSLFEEKEAKKRDFSFFFSFSHQWLFFCGGGYLSLSPLFGYLKN